MGRKNYLSCWSELGAKQLGILQNLMVTCRIQGINPYTYLVDVLQRVGIHPSKDVLDLVPRVWKIKFADNPLKSDLSIPAPR
ncbi:MAG: transposase [Francisellaceae bacterium]|jgi:transposase